MQDLLHGFPWFLKEIGRQVVVFYLWLLGFPQMLRLGHIFKQPRLNQTLHMPTFIMVVSYKDTIFSQEAVIFL